MSLPVSISHPDFVALFEAIIEEIRLIDRKVLLVYLVDQVLPEVLPYLAKDFNVNAVEWSLANTETKQRLLIKEAIELHKFKGTRWAIERIFELLDYTTVSKITEWWEVGGNGKPYHFDIDLDVSQIGQSALEWDMLSTLLTDYKRAVTDFTMTIHSELQQIIDVVAINQISEFIVIQPKPADPLQPVYVPVPAQSVTFVTTNGWSTDGAMSLINDGNDETGVWCWQNSSTLKSSVWILNFAAAITIRKIRFLSVTEGEYSPKKYHFEYWTGSVWTTITGTSVTETLQIDHYEKNFILASPLSTTKIRLVIEETINFGTGWLGYQSHQVSEITAYI